jgi:drug/metabolite transporter (DMT)-like permease
MTKAILLLFATGLSWVSVGAAVGHVERRGYNLVRYQILLCIVCVAFGLAGWAAAPTAFLPQDGAPALTWTLVIAATLLCGVFNYLMNMMMGRAMKSGPNAIVWAIIQSGLIYPFLMGWLVFGVPMGIGRFCGITLIVASVFLYAFRGEQGTGNGERGMGKCGNVKVWKQPTANVEMREWGTGNGEEGVGKLRS